MMSNDSRLTPSPLYGDEEEAESYFYYHEGRRMPAQGVYCLPADQEEFDRLESVHQMTTAILGGLCWGPVEKKLTPRPSGRRRCVLDVGTGTGSWVREMAEKYPTADFVGVDIIPVPPPASTMSGYIAPSLLRTIRYSDQDTSIYSADTPNPTRTLLQPTYDYNSRSSSPCSNDDVPDRTEVPYTERSNVRFEIHDLAHGLDFPDGIFDVIHCRYVLTLGVVEYKAAVRELLRVLRPGGLLLMAESAIPFCLSDGTDPPVGTATRELLEIVRASVRESGLDPELRLKLKSVVASHSQIDKLETRDISIPLGDWPKDESLRAIGRVGLENLAVSLRSLTPLLRQAGYDDAMMSMLASRLHEEWDISETGAGGGKSFLCTFLWATKHR